MAELNGTISGEYTAPVSFVVRKTTESSGNRCASNCTSLPLTFSADSGNNDYYFIATDSSNPPCVVDSRNIPGGISNVNCDVEQPSFNAVLQQPTCKEDGTYNAGVLKLTNIDNAARYKICYNSIAMDCAPCTDSDGTITGTSLDITLTTPNIPTNTGILLRVYADETCDVYKEWFGTMQTPSCQGTGTPEFEVQINQPACSAESGGTVQNGNIILTNILNATRYKVCYNTSTFNCDSTCSSSDGVITGTTATININAPAEGIIQNIVIRVYNGSSCDVYKDIAFSIRSPKCSMNEVTMMFLDLQVFQSSSTARCGDASTYKQEYDFYITPNTPGMTENGQQVKTGNTALRTLPAGNDVPNVYIAAGFTATCSSPDTIGASIGSTFYRHAWNMSNIKANYPLINVFTFDVYALRTKYVPDAFSSSDNVIRPRINAFTGVRMINHPYTSNNSQDADREPYFPGSSCMRRSACGQNNCCAGVYDVFTNNQDTIPDINYNPDVQGHRKIGTISYNYTTNKVTWTP